jgi:predicted Fe-S protein YdhL (DUF1289 family)
MTFEEVEQLVDFILFGDIHEAGIDLVVDKIDFNQHPLDKEQELRCHIAASIRQRYRESLISPCVKKCDLIDFETEICGGCFRTLAEIESWWEMGNEDRKKALAEGKKRRRAASSSAASDSGRAAPSEA